MNLMLIASRISSLDFELKQYLKLIIHKIVLFQLIFLLFKKICMPFQLYMLESEINFPSISKCLTSFAPNFNVCFFSFFSSKTSSADSFTKSLNISGFREGFDICFPFIELKSTSNDLGNIPAS